MQPFVSVIIPVYNDYLQLHTCLRALEQQTYPRKRFEIVVVDNDSSEIPPDPIPAGVDARWLKETKRGSYAARNLGVRNTRGEILAFIDSDCIPHPDWIERGVSAIEHLKGPGYVAGRVEVFPRDADHPTPTEYFEMVTAFRMDENMRELHWGGAGNLFVRRTIIEDIGPFDEALQSGGDAEFGKRVFAAGYQQFFAEDAVVRHPARRTLQERLTKAYRVYAGGIDLLQAGDPQARAQFSGVLPQFKPPLRKLYKIFTSPRVSHWSGRLQAAGVALTLHYTMAFEYVRTQKLGRPLKGKR